MLETIRFYSTKTAHGYMSNFSRHPFTLDGKLWPTSEHYFQAQKFPGLPHAEKIRQAKGAILAAKLGRLRSVPMRPDWDQVRESVMWDAIHAKFTQNDAIRASLLETGEATLVEDSPTDWYWGCGKDGKGENRLGVLLMRLRSELRGAPAASRGVEGRQRISSGSPFERTIGFSRAVRVGSRVLVSGTAPIWPDGSCDPDPERQARRCFEIIETALEKAGARREHVVRTRMFLTDARDADAVGRAHGAVFGEVRPAATMVVVAGLLDPRWKVEIEAEALVE